MEKYIEENRQLWEGRVAVHLKSELYDQENFMAGKSSLTEIERDELGDVSGKSLLHLQCHFGQDSLSWARKGAKVTGIDFSENAIQTARKLADELKLDTRFITTDVYDLPKVLDEKFDIVFSTFGAIPWLPDLEKWAGIVSRYLKPGGVFYLAEFHPTLFMFNFENAEIEYGYFNDGRPHSEKVENSYADLDGEEGGGVENFWNHAISEVVNPLISNGLQLLELKEYDFSPYKCFPNLIEKGKGRYYWGNLKVRFPHVFSLKMRKA